MRRERARDISPSSGLRFIDCLARVKQSQRPRFGNGPRDGFAHDQATSF